MPLAQYNIDPNPRHSGETGLRPADHDFLDFGASKGGSIDFAVARLGGRKGLGIDNDPSKIRRMRELGYDCLEADILNLDLPAKSVRFVMISHFLEHLHDYHEARQAIASAARTARDFVFIQGPYFDADDRLKEQGLKFFWSDWHGHRCHLTTGMLEGILDDLELREYVILGRTMVSDSLDPSIHPLESPRDQHDYVTNLHPPKRHVAFDPPICREMVCLVRLRRFRHWKRIVRARKGCHLIRGTVPAPVE